MYKLTVAVLAALAAGVASAAAQSWPAQPIHIVVPFPPGGGTDALARAIQEPLQKAIGQTVVIDNRGGAGGALAHDLVAKAQADGYTVLVSSNNQMLLPYLVARLSFDPATFVPIGFIAKQESVFVGSTTRHGRISRRSPRRRAPSRATCSTARRASTRRCTWRPSAMRC